MKDTEKMITEITEVDYKQNHIFMWEFVLNRIKDTSMLISDDKDVTLREVKKEYLEKVKDSLEEKEFLSAKETWLLEKINKGIRNACWACQYVLDELGYVNCRTRCPLLKNNKGKLNHWCNEYSFLCLVLQNHNYERAIELATEIKDAWRDVNE